MQYSRKTTVDQLAMTTGISAPRLRSLIRKLSRIGSLGISLEGDTVRMGKRKNPNERSFASSGPGLNSREKPLKTDSEKKESSRVEEISRIYEREENSGTVKKMPPELEVIMKDKSIGLVEKIRKLQQFGKEHPEFTQEDFKALTGNNTGDLLKSSLTGSGKTGDKKKKYPLFLIVFLFMTPLWPVALIIVIVTIVKQRKKMLSGEDGVKIT